MGKGNAIKRNMKKKPLKTIKEKRTEKRNKRNEKRNQNILK